MCRFWHIAKMTAHGVERTRQGRLLHLSGFITCHDGACASNTAPTMHIGVSILLHQIFNLINELVHCLYRLRSIHIPDWKSQIAGVLRQHLLIRRQFSLFCQIDEMSHTKMMHSFQFDFRQFPAFVAWVFASEEFASQIIRLMQRAADKCLKAVVDVKQICRKKVATATDDFTIEIAANNIERFSAGNGSRHCANGVRISTH